MIQLINERIDNIPVIHVVQEGSHDKRLPTIIYYHGFYGEKISSLTLAYKIAVQGYRVILPDSLYHGDRKKTMTDTDLNLAFWDIVLQNISEFNVLTKYLTDTGRAIQDRIGVGGTSMGAITTYGLLRTYPMIKAAASLMGTAYMTEYATMLIKEFNKNHKEKISNETAEDVLKRIESFDLTLDKQTLKNRPLLIWHGEDDKVVPYQYSPALYDELKEGYTDQNKLRFIKEKNRAHHISRLSMDEAATWFCKYV